MLTVFMPVIASAGPLKQLNMQSCNYVCGISEFTTIIPEDKINNTVLITTTYAGRGVRIFIQNTLNPAYQKLRILDISRYRAPGMFEQVFQSMPPEHTIHIVFDSAFTEENVPLPLTAIEAMHSFAILKKNESTPMQNDDKVEKKTTNHHNFFSLCVWNREATLSLSTQEKEKTIKSIINIMDEELSLLIQQNTADLQTHHYQKTYDFTPSIQSTPYPRPRCLASPPAHYMRSPEEELLFPHLMLPPKPLSPHFMIPPEEPLSPHLMLPPEPLSPCFMLPSQPLPPHFMLSPRRPLVPSLPHSIRRPPFIPSHAYSQPYVKPPALLPISLSPQTMTGITSSHIDNAAHTHSNTKYIHATNDKTFYEKKRPFLQQVYTVGCFKIPLCDTKYVRIACMKQFGYITFDDHTHDDNFFLSNFFSCKTPFSIGNQKIKRMSVMTFIIEKKLDYFNPPLPTEMKEYFFDKLKTYDDIAFSHGTSSMLQELKEKTGTTYVFKKEKWKNIFAPFLFQVLFCKFNSSETLKEKLLTTGNKIIIYQNMYKHYYTSIHVYNQDSFWGVDIKNGNGYNVRGNLLCLVREYLRDGKTPLPFHDI